MTQFTDTNIYLISCDVILLWFLGSLLSINSLAAAASCFCVWWIKSVSFLSAASLPYL